MFSVALICTANRGRSVMAHAILADEVKKRGLAINVYSAGVIDFTDEPQLEETSETCLRYQTSPPADTPSFVRQLPLDSIDRFLVMEQFHAEMLVHNFAVDSERVSLLGNFDPQGRGVEISDPFGKGRRAYQESYELIRDCITEYLNQFGRQSNP
jgi:protein-tyrosine phosphatase